MTEQTYNRAIEAAAAALRKANGGSVELNIRLATTAVNAAFGVMLRDADTVDDGRILAIPTTELATRFA